MATVSKKNLIKSRPMVLIVVKNLLGKTFINREHLIKGLGLPFILNIVENEVRVVDMKTLFQTPLEDIQGIIIHTNTDPTSIGDMFIGKETPCKTVPLIHYTALSYSAMTEEQKSSWKNLVSAEGRLTPTTLSKRVVMIPKPQKPKVTTQFVKK